MNIVWDEAGGGTYALMDVCFSVEGDLPLLSGPALLGRRLEALAGQPAILLVGAGADIMNPSLVGAVTVRVSHSPVSGDGEFGWASIGETFHGFRLDRLQGVFSLEEAAECGIAVQGSGGSELCVKAGSA